MRFIKRLRLALLASLAFIFAFANSVYAESIYSVDGLGIKVPRIEGHEPFSLGLPQIACPQFRGCPPPWGGSFRLDF